MSEIKLDGFENSFMYPNGQTIVTFASSPVDVNYAKPNTYGSRVPNYGGVKAVRWGIDGKLPFNMLKLVSQNHIKPQLLKTERDFLLGSRLGLFEQRLEKDAITGKNKRVVEPIQNSEIEDWLEMVDVDIVMRKLSYNYVFSHNYFLSCSLDKNKKVDAIQSWDFNTVLAEEIQSGRINNYFVNPNWLNPKATDTQTIAAFNKKNPTELGNFMYHGRDWIPGQPYYDWATWWGSEKWTEVSNLIPLFHKSGLLNGYNIKYHIEIPQVYFKQFGDVDAQKKAEKDLKQNMNDFLSGPENADKAFVSKFTMDDFGKPLPGFKITPLDNFMSDEAYIKLDNNANINQSSAHGINPGLASIDTGGKLGGSGLEIKVAYQSHIAIHTPNDREILLEWFNRAVRPIMGWDRKYILGFEDIDLSVPDTNQNPNKAADINSKMG